MMTLDKNTTGLLIIDVQDKLFDKVERSCEVMQKMIQMIRGSKILGLPIVVTEQYPKGLGRSVCGIQGLMEDNFDYIEKTTFSCLGEKKVVDKITPVHQWILIGIEAHVCVLQTAKDLLKMGKEVVVLNDAISSRSIYDYSTAIAELRDCGARISSVETVLFEMVKDSSSPVFKEISQLVK